ncbi:hypothetical protein BHE74_00040690 [Ensete ventricosum]|nr:hypothetical protein BHE74_00040690 [Ensete ventricosum]
MREVLWMIREARVEVMALSNSYDHSLARCLNTVQSLLREHGSKGDGHSTFASTLTMPPSSTIEYENYIFFIFYFSCFYR